MLINIHLNPPFDDDKNYKERFDTLISPSSTIATLLAIEREIGRDDIVGIDEAFPGEVETKREIRRLIEEDIREGRIPVLIFTLLLYNSEPAIKYINELKRELGGKIKIVVGGQLVPLAREAYLKNRDIDVVCVGDAEVILPNLLADLETGNLSHEYHGWVREESDKQFSGVSFDGFFGIRERLAAQKETVGFSQLTIQGPGGPGCAWAISNAGGPCSFCALQNITTSNTTSIEEYLENERRLEEQFHPDRFFDVANHFLPTLKPGEIVTWLENYIEIRKRKGIQAKKYAYLSVSSVNDKIAGLLAEAGISEVYLGIDHFNEEALKAENKSFRHQRTLKKCLDALTAHGIMFRAGIVLGSAEETAETLDSVRSGIHWMVSNYKSCIKAVGIFPIDMLPGSKDFEKMRASGICPGLFDNFDRLGYLSRSEQRRMTELWIQHHSHISPAEVTQTVEAMLTYLKTEGVFGYRVDKASETKPAFHLLLR